MHSYFPGPVHMAQPFPVKAACMTLIRVAGDSCCRSSCSLPALSMALKLRT
jgi:hypothetical protein